MKLKQAVAQRFFALLIATSIILLQISSSKLTTQLLDRLDGVAYDFKLRLASKWPSGVANIQIVDIDEQSLYEIGRMPWDRDHFGTLVAKLSELGAVVIAFDVLFSEPQENIAKTLFSEMHISPENPNFSQWQQNLQLFDNDQLFADEMKKTDVILSTLFHHQQDLNKGTLSTEAINQTIPKGLNNLSSYSGFNAPIELLANAAAGHGFMNSHEDHDGFVRRAPLVIESNGYLYPSLALETFRIYSLADQITTKWKSHAQSLFIDKLLIGNHSVTMDRKGRVIVPFRGPPGTYQYTSASDILNSKIKDGRFEQSVVFVGTSVTGLADLKATPVSLSYPGVEIHATVFDSLMSPQAQPYRPDWWLGAISIELLLIALLSISLFPKLGPLSCIILAISLLGLAIGANLALWYYFYIDLPVITILTLVACMAVYYTAYGFFQETLRREKVKAIFDQYVPPAHINRLLENPEATSLEGEKRELSVLFSDIRSFTSISESMSAHHLKRWLNEYFSPMTQAVLQHDGTVDKYVGDMVMAFWGAPIDEAKHAYKSIAAAFSMLSALENLNKRFRSEGRPEAHMGIGINTGEMNVGDMGSDFRRSYTVIGDAVNLGARLEGLTKFYGVDILVSEFTQKQAPEFDYMLIDKVKVKGKQKPVLIYMPILPTVSSRKKKILLSFNIMLEAYYEQQFIKAREHLLAIQCELGNHTLANIYLQRITHFLNHKPDSHWDGSFTHTTK